MKRLLLFVLIMMIPSLGSARTINVPEDARSIVIAINTSQNEDTVLVAPGTYRENLVINNRIITIASDYVITGDPAYIDSTIIEGNGASRVVTFRDVESRDMLLQGFTIRGGEGGIYCYDSSPTLSDLIITENEAGYGGGIYALSASDPYIFQCDIRANTADFGGGIALKGASARIERTLITDNIAPRTAGGIYSEQGRLDLINVTMSLNRSEQGTDCILKGSGELNLVNGILWGHDSEEINAGNNLNVNISYTDIEGGRQGISQGNITWGEGNINEDPMFVAAEEGDFHLQPDSPCLDAGDPEFAPDPDGTRVDMGALITPHGGFLHGWLYDAENDQPFENTLVDAQPGGNALTDSSGYWVMNIVPSGDFLLTASYEGFLDSVYQALNIGLEDTLELHIGLLHSEFMLSTAEINANCIVDSSVQSEFRLENDGNGVLEWTAELRVRGEAGFDPWTLRSSCPVGQILDNNRLYGVAYVEGNYFVTGRADEGANQVYIFDLEGNLTGQFDQFGESRNGIKDLAYDGELLWGAEDNMVYGFSLDGNLVNSWECPINPVTNITWDADNQYLWLNSITTNIKAFNPEGVEQTEVSRSGLRVRGLAYWPADPDDYNLYITVEDPVPAVYRMNLVTGDTMLAGILESAEDWRPAGAFIIEGFDKYSSTLIYIADVNGGEGDRIDIRQLTTNTAWMELDALEGSINPELDDPRILTVDASSLSQEIGEIYEGEIVFSHNAAGSTATLPINIRIVNEDAIADQNDQIPGSYSIQSIYPNPFNSTASITFSLPVKDRIHLSLFEINGREVATLVDSEMKAGMHRVDYQADLLPTGLYFLRLEGCAGVVSRKIVLVK